MRLVVFVILAACGADSRTHPVAEPQPQPQPQPAPDATVEALDTSARDAIDAGMPAQDAAQSCFCFSWVHRDENGQSCFPTRPACDAEFQAFGRDMKRPCEPETVRCNSYACRGAGKQCFEL